MTFAVVASLLRFRMTTCVLESGAQMVGGLRSAARRCRASVSSGASGSRVALGDLHD
jgi:hypothetical protein